MLAACVILIIILLSVNEPRNHVTGRGIVLDDASWETTQDGFRYYNREGYHNSFGIDISEWVEDIDFRALKKSGVEFVILRVGYRGYETGKFVLDQQLQEYLREARNAGLMTGAYFVSQAISEEEAREEAEYVIGHIRNYAMEMPLYIDLETVYDAARTDDLTKDQQTKIAVAFCETIEENGYRAGIYANESWFQDKLNFRDIASYDIWLAKYADTPSTELPVNMWQFTDEGLVEGTDFFVDKNVRVSLPEGSDLQETTLSQDNADNTSVPVETSTGNSPTENPENDTDNHTDQNEKG